MNKHIAWSYTPHACSSMHTAFPEDSRHPHKNKVSVNIRLPCCLYRQQLATVPLLRFQVIQSITSLNRDLTSYTRKEEDSGNMCHA